MADPKIVLTAVDKTSAAFASATANLRSLGERALSVTGVLGGLGVSLSAGAALAWVKTITDGVDALNDLSDATGSSIENISALEDVAARTGTSMDAVGAALTKFNMLLKDAKPGSDAEAAMKALNLNIKELQALDPAEALRRTAVALSGFADDGNKARLVQELFGKSVKQVAPFLKDLAEKGALVATVTTEQAKAAEAFNKEIFSLQKNVTDLGRSLAGPLVESLNATAEAFRRSKKEGKDFLESVWDRYTSNVKDFKAGGGNLGPFSLGEDRRPKFLIDYAAQNESAAEKARLQRRPTVSLPDAPGGGKAKPADKAIASATNELQAYLQTLEKTYEKTQELSAVETARLRIGENLTRTSSVLVQQQIMGLAEQIDLTKKLNAEQEERIKIGRQAAIDSGVDNTAYQDQLARLLESTPGAELERARADLILLTQEFEAGRLSEEKYLEAVTARAGITTRELEKTTSIADELGLSFSSAFEDAIVGGKGLSSVIKGLGDDILRITIRKSITEPLSGFFSSALGGLFGGFKAEGGPVSAGVPYIVGERGPEWFVPGQSGGIIPNGAKGGGSQPIVINISNTVGEIVTPSQLRQNNRALVQQIQAGLGRSVQYGGALS
jgi:hypothetical protein